MALNDVQPFRYWAHKIIPLVYDDSLSYYEFLAKVVAKLNEVISQENEQNEYILNTFDSIMNDLDGWKTAVNAELTIWKNQTESDIEEWENDVVDDLNEWRRAFDELFSSIQESARQAGEDAQSARQSASVASDYAESASSYASLAQSFVGSPLVASTASAMTDHNRIYVYVGNESGYTSGNWYYYNGSAWVSGGVYNSSAVQTDASLSIAGMPADAKATGDVKTAVEELFIFDQLLLATQVAANNNTAMVNNGDGSYTVGTTDNGNTTFGYQMTFTPGIYLLFGVPNGISYISTTGTPSTSYNDRLYSNTSTLPLQIHITTTQFLWVCFRSPSRPSSPYIIYPTLYRLIPRSGRQFPHTIAFFGDSIIWGHNGASSSTAQVKYTIPLIVGNALSCSTLNYGVSGQGYVSNTASPANAYDNISSKDLTSFDTLVLCYGTNDGFKPLGTWDSTDETTVMGQFNKIINYIYQQNPTMRVIVFAPFNGTNVGSYPDYWYGPRDSQYVSRKVLSDTLKRACNYYWIPYIEQYDSPLNAKTITEYLPDGVHPNANGYKVVGEWFSGKIRGLL